MNRISSPKQECQAFYTHWQRVLWTKIVAQKQQVDPINYQSISWLTFRNISDFSPLFSFFSILSLSAHWDGLIYGLACWRSEKLFCIMSQPCQLATSYPFWGRLVGTYTISILLKSKQNYITAIFELIQSLLLCFNMPTIRKNNTILEKLHNGPYL